MVGQLAPQDLVALQIIEKGRDGPGRKGRKSKAAYDQVKRPAKRDGGWDGENKHGGTASFSVPAHECVHTSAYTRKQKKKENKKKDTERCRTLFSEDVQHRSRSDVPGRHVQCASLPLMERRKMIFGVFVFRTSLRPRTCSTATAGVAEAAAAGRGDDRNTRMTDLEPYPFIVLPSSVPIFWQYFGKKSDEMGKWWEATFEVSRMTTPPVSPELPPPYVIVDLLLS